jgi:hypothetical protein
MTDRLTAHAVTVEEQSSAWPVPKPGIHIRVPGRAAPVRYEAAPLTERGGWQEEADAVLARMGYVRRTPWTRVSWSFAASIEELATGEGK